MKVKATADPNLPFEKIRPAYVQIADQIREMIIRGILTPGERLPVEDDLAKRFGVSRNTVREALRSLSSLGLVVTTRGASGGSFVARLDRIQLRDQFETGLGLLSTSNEITGEELFETRLLIEVPGARWAAERRSEEDLHRMRQAARAVEAGTVVIDRANSSMDFHQAVLEAAGNRVLSMIGPPIWRVFACCALQRGGKPHLWGDIDRDHDAILHHIECRRPDEAGSAMEQHLRRLHENEL